MKTRILVPSIIIALLVGATAAIPGPRDAFVHVTRLGGNTFLAQPLIDKFLRHVETAAAWTPSSMQGSFLVSKKKALEFIDKKKPGIGIMEPPLYFEFRKVLRLQPLLQAESKDLVSDRLHLVVKDAAWKDLAQLKGKRLWTTLADYPTYLSKVVLGGQVNAADHFVLIQIGQAMKGARGVLRGDCEATLLDDEQLAEARKIEGGSSLRTIHDSPALPPLPVVVFGSSLSASERDAFVNVLIRMCDTLKGGAICRSMHIARFAPLNAALFNDIQKRYGE